MKINNEEWLYLAVTNDDYQLPVYITDSPGELAELTGIKKSTMRSIISRKEDERKKSKRKKKLLYLKVKID